MSKMIEEISKSKESYKNELNDIKISFQSHLREVNLYGLKPEQLYDRINYIINNIESDKKRLSDLIVKIKTDIERLNDKKESSKNGAIISGIIGVVSGIGGIIATGGASVVYTLSTIGNLISLSSHVKSIYDCCALIDELLIIQKDAEEELEKIKKAINDLNLMSKRKERNLPAYFQEYDKISEKQSVYLKKFPIFLK